MSNTHKAETKGYKYLIPLIILVALGIIVALLIPAEKFNNDTAKDTQESQVKSTVDKAPASPTPTPTQTLTEPIKAIPVVKPELNVPIPFPCTSNQLVNRNTKFCNPRKLTGTERLKQTTNDYALKDWVLLEDTSLLEDLTIRVANYNVLGASHTRNSAPEPRRHWASGSDRIKSSMNHIRQMNITVAGFQEFQHSQYFAFKNVAPNWAAYPGIELGSDPVQNSVVWDTTVWKRISAHTIPIPYFRGKPKPMPFVKLQHIATGKTLWIGSFHNPANVAGDATKHRAEAVRREAREANRLKADGTPVIVTGDMNDREDFICPFTRMTGMVASTGAGFFNGSCHTPRPLYIDWIVGTGIKFEGHTMDWSTHHRKWSDHPLIHTRAIFTPPVDSKQCETVSIAGRDYVYCPKAILPGGENGGS